MSCNGNSGVSKDKNDPKRKYRYNERVSTLTLREPVRYGILSTKCIKFTNIFCEIQFLMQSTALPLKNHLISCNSGVRFKYFGPI